MIHGRIIIFFQKIYRIAKTSKLWTWFKHSESKDLAPLQIRIVEFAEFG